MFSAALLSSKYRTDKQETGKCSVAYLMQATLDATNHNRWYYRIAASPLTFLW